MLTRKNRNEGEAGSCPDGVKQFIARVAEGLDPAGAAAAQQVDVRAPLGNMALKALLRALQKVDEPTLGEREEAGIVAGADDDRGAGAAVAAGGGGDLEEPWVVGPWHTDFGRFAVPMRARVCVLRTVFGARVALPVLRFPPTAKQVRSRIGDAGGGAGGAEVAPAPQYALRKVKQ